MVSLRAFLGGYSVNHCLRASEAVWFPINDHLRTRYGISQSAHGYPELLLLITSGVTEAFVLFFNEFDEFLSAHRAAASNPSSWPHPLPEDSVDVDRHFSFMATLEAMEARPALYLGRPSVTGLRAFLAGELVALQDSGRDIGEMSLLESFESWLNAKERFTARYRWDRILLFESGGCEEDAFLNFFPLFRAHTAERM